MRTAGQISWSPEPHCHTPHHNIQPPRATLSGNQLVLRPRYVCPLAFTSRKVALPNTLPNTLEPSGPVRHDRFLHLRATLPKRQTSSPGAIMSMFLPQHPGTVAFTAVLKAPLIPSRARNRSRRSLPVGPCKRFPMGTY